jgi:hypothetical protein
MTIQWLDYQWKYSQDAKYPMYGQLLLVSRSLTLGVVKNGIDPWKRSILEWRNLSETLLGARTDVMNDYSFEALSFLGLIVIVDFGITRQLGSLPEVAKLYICAISTLCFLTARLIAIRTFWRLIQ